MRRWLACRLLLCIVAATAAEGEMPARYEIKQGEFPPENSAHRISGELIGVDHINRTGTLRPDRTNDQRTDDYDRPMPFTMLPYGTLSYHGAPAELRDIPIGTHLHGEFYFDPKAGKDNKGAYTQAFRLQDDFSLHTQQQRTWRIDAVQIDKGTLTVTGQSGAENKPDEKPLTFKVSPATRVWKGKGFGRLEDLAVGQSVLLNITVATLKGPGRCTDVWLDAESRQLAVTRQTEVHREFMKTRGLPGWVESVDDAQNLVTVTLFSCFDPALKAPFKKDAHVHPAVAEESLRSYDQINDALSSAIVEVKAAPIVPGSSGLQIVFKPQIMLEGYRPRRIVRMIADVWRLDDLPYEERLYK
jgi:hypothetical protein